MLNGTDSSSQKQLCCFSAHLITLFSFGTPFAPVSPEALMLIRKTWKHFNSGKSTQGRHSVFCVAFKIYRICSPVIQENQVTHADHLPHFPHLSPGPQLVLEGPWVHAHPVREHQLSEVSSWTFANQPFSQHEQKPRTVTTQNKWHVLLWRHLLSPPLTGLIHHTDKASAE